jgi:hypothetical protein
MTEAADKAAPTQPITADSLRALLESQKVVLSGKLPNAASLQLLALKLDSLRTNVYLRRGAWREDEARLASVRAALSTLAEWLPPTLEVYREVLMIASANERSNADRFQKNIEALESLSRAMYCVCVERTEVIFPMSIHFSNVESRSDCAPIIAEYFRHAMQSTNPDLVLKDSNKGPVPRFVAAVMPFIIGESPTAEAMGKELQRKAKKVTQADSDCHGDNQPQ